MPAMPVARQPDVSPGWFASRASQALFASELPSLQQALAARPGLPWLAFSAFARPGSIDPPRGLWLSPCGGGWRGDVACGVPLPLASGFSVDDIVYKSCYVSRERGAAARLRRREANDDGTGARAFWLASIGDAGV